MPDLKNGAFLVNQQLSFAQSQIKFLQQDGVSTVQKNALKQACAWQLCSALTLFFIERRIIENFLPLHQCVSALDNTEHDDDVCTIKLRQQADDTSSYLNALVGLQLSLYEKHVSAFFSEPDTQIIALSRAPKYHWIAQSTDFYQEIYTWLAQFVRAHREQTQQW